MNCSYCLSSFSLPGAKKDGMHIYSETCLSLVFVSLTILSEIVLSNCESDFTCELLTGVSPSTDFRCWRAFALLTRCNSSLLCSRHKSEDDYRRQVIEMCCLHDSCTVISTIAKLIPTTGVGGDPAPAAHGNNTSVARASPGHSSGGPRGQTMDSVDHSGQDLASYVRNGDAGSSGDSDESCLSACRSDCVTNVNTSVSFDNNGQPNFDRYLTDLSNLSMMASPVGVPAAAKETPRDLVTAAGSQPSSSAQCDGRDAGAGASSEQVFECAARVKRDKDGKVSVSVAQHCQVVDPTQLTGLLGGLAAPIQSAIMAGDDETTFKCKRLSCPPICGGRLNTTTTSNNNNNVHLSCAYQRPERSDHTY